MIAPALPRWVAGVLNEPTTGVNALAPSVPRSLGDPEAPEVAIYNAVDDAWVARKHSDDEATPDQWVLAVRVAEDLDLAGSPSENGGDDTATIIVELQGVTADEQDNAITLAIAYRVMRAVRRALNMAFIAQQMEPLHLEGQLISLPDRLQGITLDGKPGSGTVSLALLLPFSLIDTWALGAEETT